MKATPPPPARKNPARAGEEQISYSVIEEELGAGYLVEDGIGDGEFYGVPEDADGDGEVAGPKSEVEECYGVEDDDEERESEEGSASSSSSETGEEPDVNHRRVRLAVSRDWIDEVELDSDELLAFGRSTKWSQLSDVYNDFQDTARNLGRIIISEMHLPDECKSIQPTSMGGVAGGKKYIRSGILFKFAEDAKLGDGTYLYGNVAPDLGKANKACGHEIKSCNAFCMATMELGVSHLLRCPLMAKINYRGSCMVALSLLPIDGKSLVLGSNNGKTCVRSDDEAATLASAVCSLLGLQEHAVHGVTVPACGDLEVHRGTDGRLYVLDYARLFPPEGPVAGRRVGKEIFYALLRPEFVRRWAKDKPRLVSDVFSGWGRSDPDWRIHNELCITASCFMREEMAKAAAAFVDSQVFRANDFYLHLHDVVLRQAVSLANTLQRRFGVNVRHLGLVRDQCKSAPARMMLLTIMVVRTIKADVNAKLRDLAAKLRLTFEAPFHSLLVENLNLIGSLTSVSGHFWKTTLPQKVEAKFGPLVFLPDDWSPKATDLSQRVSVALVQYLVARALGCEWIHPRVVLDQFRLIEDGKVDLRLFGAARDFEPPIQKTDISPAQPHITTSGLAFWFDARAKISAAMELMAAFQFKPAQRVLQSARDALVEQRGASAEMFVDIAWAGYLVHKVTSIVDSSANVRGLLREARERLQEAEAMGCSSGRLRCLKVLVSLSSGILHRDTTTLFYEQEQWLDALQCAAVIKSLSARDLGILCGEMTAVPLESVKLRFAIRLLLADKGECAVPARAADLAIAWLRMPNPTEVHSLIAWAGLAEEGPAEAFPTPSEERASQLLYNPFALALTDLESRARLLEECERNPLGAAAHLLLLPLRQSYRIDMDSGRVELDKEPVPMPPDVVMDFALPFVVKWSMPDSIPLVQQGLVWLEMCAPYATQLRPAKCIHKSRRTDPFASIWQPLPLLTTLLIPTHDLSAFTLALIAKQAHDSLSCVSLQSSSSCEAAEVVPILCGLKRLTKLKLAGFDFSEANQNGLLEILRAHSATLEEFAFEGYFGPFAGPEQVVPELPCLKSLSYISHDQDVSLLERLLALAPVSKLEIGISAACAVPRTLLLSRLRVQSCIDVAPFLLPSLEKLSLLENCPLPADVVLPHLKQLRLPQGRADWSLVERAPLLSRIRSACDPPSELVWSPLLNHVKLFDMRQACPSIAGLAQLSVLVLSSSRQLLCVVPTDFTHLTVLHLEGIDLGPNPNGTVSTLLKNNANLHTLHCERVSRFSHEFIDDAATRDAFASRIVDATLLSDNSDSFRALRFVERLLECKTVALTSLVVTDLNSMMLMLFKAKLGLRFPKIEVKFHK